jgi:signal transduction histidine kinase
MKTQTVSPDNTEINQRIMALQNEHQAELKVLTELLAHEVNTPLQTLLISLESIPEASDEEQQLFIEQVRKQVERIGKIMNQLKNRYVYEETV